MQPVVRTVLCVSTLLVLAMVFSVGTVPAQEQGKSDQTAKVGDQGSTTQGQGNMGGMGPMT
jgi:hypothetical protein